jgi:hypothetical protein
MITFAGEKLTKILIMKKITITFAAATVAILLLFTGCDKYHTNRYIGDWDFVTEKKTFHHEEIIKRDTIYYIGKIRGNNEWLTIQYTESDENLFQIDKEGNIYYICGGGYCIFGNFEGENKVSFRILDYKNDGRVHKVIGVKKKGGKK